MDKKISRRKLAQHFAKQVKNGQAPEKAIDELAAYLIVTGRTREQEIVLRAIADELQSDGVILAQVTTAHKLTSAARQEILDKIAKLVASKVGASSQIYLREIIDPDVIGGVKIDLPNSQFDETIQSKLIALKAQKV